MKKFSHRSLQLRAVSASFVGLSLTLAIALVASSYLPVSSAFPSSSSQASVLTMAVDDSSGQDTSSDDGATDDNVGTDENTQTPEEELASLKEWRVHLVDAVKVRNSSKSKVRSFKSMMASCDRKSSGKSKDKCLINLAAKMQMALRAICVFDDVTDMSCNEDLTSSFPYDPTAEDFSAEDEVTPFLEDALQALDSNLLSLTQQPLNDYMKEIDARIEELTSFLDDNAAPDETDASDDTVTDAAKVDPNRECFDHNQKAYLSTQCIEKRKKQGSL